jgi:hypothetical protein
LLLGISGSGDNGALEADVLMGRSENHTRPSLRIVTGVNTGALIAPFAFVGSEYDPLLAENVHNDSSSALAIITTTMDASVPVRLEYRRHCRKRTSRVHRANSQDLARVGLDLRDVSPVMFDVFVDGVARQEMLVDGGVSKQTAHYPATPRVTTIANGSRARSRVAYTIHLVRG